jgi:hypothetical protein
LRVIAEWVETEADAQILQSLGVDYLQGNLFGEPSIEAPWQARNDANFQLLSSNLPPVDTSYFEANIPAIEDPRISVEVSAELSAPVATEPPEVETITIAPVAIDTDIAALDDDALTAEIEAWDMRAEDDAAVALDVTPVWETALQHQLEAESMVTSESSDIDDTTDDNLANLRAALAELNAAFQPEPESQERLAS